ncbi:morn domain repeat protein [Ichthyophthirius multifiliis]|uniref:Morn domain repeat protein n=1 Tax=Ichthyophthirius multifiliis TaxID=5932 RepID=G0QMY5_ICHMU|nr:morn domain repeat protein [Ichthyophthirius multifiliis]EGR33418.1 morn domain repeat protein [Ichthyophthirius multifiliis]|eukprot:XP_004037404.1 morn domain repeat protein [Ichthyophthirius multifiliis]
MTLINYDNNQIVSNQKSQLFKEFEEATLIIDKLKNKLKNQVNIKKIQYQTNSYYQGQIIQIKSNIYRFFKKIQQKQNNINKNRHGWGLYYMQNGDVYGGFFQMNQFQGEGTYIYKNGDIYKGELNQNNKHGIGTYFYMKYECIYQGKWENNVKDGYGILVYKSNVDFYEGYFKDNIKFGQGVFNFSNGDQFNGVWLEKMNFAKGQLQQNKQEYKDIFLYEDDPFFYEGIFFSYKYIENYSFEKKNGDGIFYYKNTDKYIGDFINGMRNGFGKYFYSNGCVYEGHWKNNQKESSNATFYFPDKTLYQGQFQNSFKEGFGKQTYQNNEFYEGEWKQDKRNGKGKYVFYDESFYEGDWENDEMNGLGTFYQKSDNKYQVFNGLWNKNEIEQIFYKQILNINQY